MKKFYVIILLVLVLSGTGFSQVTVAPVTVHLSDAERNGYIVVRNNSNITPWEVSIDMKFGYPVSDSSGKTVMYFPEKESDTDPSAVKWINFYPRKFVLQPLEEQTVRIAAKPKNVKEGEYWGRPVIISKAVNAEDTTGKGNINAGMSVEFRTVIALNYRRGSVKTGISFDNLTGKFEENKFVLFAKVKREGNAAYIGNLLVNITNEKGSIVKETKQEISVYYELNKRIEIETGKLPAGKYNISVQLNTDREETGGKILKGNTEEKKITITVN
ncbi:MAG: hypothetical protein PHN88_15370 [Ignavibacteria bacterium]|nr:hypothetical protein [Ignavibacteria bacterium]